MNKKKYVVSLTDKEREDLETLVSQGKAAARKIGRAWILLKADAAGPAWPDEQIRTTFAVGLATIYRVRQSFVEEGLEAVLTRRPKSRHRHRKLDGDQEAHLIALACGKPPPGRRRWTIRLLAQKMVELEYTDCVCSETVRRTLKKRTETAPGEDVVHPSDGQRRVRVAHGSGPGTVQAPLRPALPRGVHGRSEQAVGGRGKAAAGDEAGTGAQAGRRVRA
jgi:transposase